jgi:hypothetical protein
MLKAGAIQRLPANGGKRRFDSLLDNTTGVVHAPISSTRDKLRQAPARVSPSLPPFTGVAIASD